MAGGRLEYGRGVDVLAGRLRCRIGAAEARAGGIGSDRFPVSADASACRGGSHGGLSNRDSIQIPRRQAHEARRGGDGCEGRKDALDALVGALQMGVAADKRSPQGANAPVYEDP